nr:RNA-directed DNA polymerase, eukaryota, reverse transcriptase zinc-binding domain protein [Tanacetum cinerariifolium]
TWKGDRPLKEFFPRLFTFEKDKDILVAVKVTSSVDCSFRRHVLRGAEQQQRFDLSILIDSATLSSSHDRWVCDLAGDGEF